MGAMKNFLLEQINDLSERTGYSADFLIDMWKECANDGCDWDYFKTVTLERDW